MYGLGVRGWCSRCRFQGFGFKMQVLGSTVGISALLFGVRM